ncbi:hypothetical protein BU16DRAFT_567269 [Lophium mytilinum]|uniref:BTB domain-containing protein n=1 Tax=Lophium mytilinum TaxID=390894 RepID=A0A6A6QAM0_9PEZI|nr:hypothetical protein BU16DRAFT_567269 [Lophium mytilinum]
MPDPNGPAAATDGTLAESSSLPFRQIIPSVFSEEPSKTLERPIVSAKQPEPTRSQSPAGSTPARPQHAGNQAKTHVELDLDGIDKALASIGIKDSATIATTNVITGTPSSTALIIVPGSGSAAAIPCTAAAAQETNQSHTLRGTPATFVPYIEEALEGTTQHYQTITMHPFYRNSSLEELRLRDYSNSRIYGPGSSTISLQPHPGNFFGGARVAEPLFPPAPVSGFGPSQTTLFGLFQDPFGSGRGVSGPIITLQIPASNPSGSITEQHVHLSLALQSPYLRIMLLGRLVHPSSPSNSTLKLDLETPEIVDMAIQFLYTGSVTLKLLRSSTELEALRRKLSVLETLKLCRLWLLAVKLRMPKLQNEAIRLLWVKLGLDPGVPDLQQMTLSSATIDWVYSKTAPDDALRRLVVTVFSIRTKPSMVKQGLKAGEYQILSLEFWREAWMVDRDAALGVKEFYVEE